MKKKWIKPTVLVTVFFVALIFFNLITKQSSEDMTTTMARATMPVMYFQEGDVNINEMHGYAQEMNAAMVRDSITPVGDDRNLTLLVDSYGQDVQELSYEIRSLDKTRLVANGDLTDALSKDGRKYTVTFQVQNLLEKYTEYLLILHLTTEEQDAYYYTRIIQAQDYYAEECLDFALQFHDYTFRDDAATFIPTYMDPATGDATTLAYVDLSCSLKQITWADFDCKKLTTPVLSFKEINSSYNVITLDYVVVYTTESGEMEYYNVEEYYRLRETATRMYVLNFERRMNQIFRSENSFVTDKTKIQLGIRDEHIEYASNESGDVVAFVQEGDLWRFSQSSNELTKVFSFRGEEGIDVRENWNQHDIQVMGIDEVGSVDFIIYGYMNRGIHEGEVGIGVYRYDGISHTVEEEGFIPVDRSYEVLGAELGQLMYGNDQGFVYILMDGAVYRIDMLSLNAEIVLDGLKDGCYATSESNRFFAWVEPGKKYSSEKIQIMDLKNGEIFETEADSEGCQIPMGFVGEDFVYGIADKDEIQVDAAGNVTFPIKKLKIMATAEEKHGILKTYEPEGKRVASISIQNHMIQVDLAKVVENHLESCGTDTIMNRDAEEEEIVTITSTVTDVKETQYQLALKKEIDTGKTKQIVAKSMIVEEIPIIKLKSSEEKDRFYVYVKGDVLLATDSISDAIRKANDQLGVVVDENQNYVWMRARKQTQNAFSALSTNEGDADADSIACAISIMLQRNDVDVTVHTLLENGQTPKGILEQYLKEKTVLDLSGCTVEEVIFYVSNGSPVFALADQNRAVLIVGYTSNNVFLYNPKTRTTESVTMENASEMFENAGNVFFSYL